MNRDQKDARQTVSVGVSAWERDDFEGALTTFLAVLDEFPYFADVQNKAGLCHAMLNRPEDALTHFDLALGLNAAYAEAHLNRGIVLNELGRHDDAQGALERADELDRRDSKTFPSDVGNRIAITLAQLGDLYLLAEHPEEAAQHYETALGIRPRFLDIRTKFSEALISLGRVEQAASELEFILEARPSFVGARVRLGVVFNKTGNTAGAIREWKQCLVDDPKDMRARAYLASVGVTFPHAHRADAEKDAG